MGMISNAMEISINGQCLQLAMFIVQYNDEYPDDCLEVRLKDLAWLLNQIMPNSPTRSSGYSEQSPCAQCGRAGEQIALLCNAMYVILSIATVYHVQCTLHCITFHIALRIVQCRNAQCFHRNCLSCAIPHCIVLQFTLHCALCIAALHNVTRLPLPELPQAVPQPPAPAAHGEPECTKVCHKYVKMYKTAQTNVMM